jgi:hypothetical protein
MHERVPFSTLKGLTLKDVWRNDTSVLFETRNGEKYQLAHEQDCCESVYLADVVGSLSDLYETPIELAEESTSRTDAPPQTVDESYTWTYYRLRTIRGTVSFRFFGSSNGYYSESVELYRIA